MRCVIVSLFLWCTLILPIYAVAQDNGRPRARDIGLAVGTFPTGPYNAITDVDGVLVGHATVIECGAPRMQGKGHIGQAVLRILLQVRSQVACRIFQRGPGFCRK